MKRAEVFWIGFFVFVLAVLMAVFGGCAVLQTASTDVRVELPDGRVITYNSTKDQAGIDLQIIEIDPRSGKITKKWIIKVEKSGTPEAAYSALADQQRSVAEIIKTLIPIVEKAAALAAPGPL